MPEPAGPPRHTAFDWRIYADATLAGLSALVPLPLVDLAFEAYFRRRIPAAIGRARGRRPAEGARRRFGRGSGRLLSAAGCLALPLLLARYVVKKLWRKVIYVFAIADASSQVSAYWHRAYLLDHIIRAGHAGPEVDWPRSARVADRVLEATDTGPLTGLARQVVASSHRVLRLLIRARRHGAAEEADSLAAILRSHWDAAEGSLIRVALRYNEAYASSLELEPPLAVEKSVEDPR